LGSAAGGIKGTKVKNKPPDCGGDVLIITFSLGNMRERSFVMEKRKKSDPDGGLGRERVTLMVRERREGAEEKVCGKVGNRAAPTSGKANSNPSP